jgi:glycosyltransferase involved in cell wall biosynthesis
MISIVIPTYNRLEDLRKCVTSVIRQSYHGLQIVIVDDSSQDDTRRYLQELTCEYDFVTVLYNDKNYGVNYSRNRGISTCSNRFILFLDSDDELADGSIEKVKSVLEANPGTIHFLFVVSDRESEFSDKSYCRNVWYRDWISGKIQGDFTHVVDSSIMKKNLFFEQFRTFEHLNWLRVKKQTSPQLLVPFIVANRDRNRADSLTSSMKLNDSSRIRSKFESEKLYYSLYYADLEKYNPASLSSQLLNAVILGTACGQRSECLRMFRYARTWRIRFFASLVLAMPSSLLIYAIRKYSMLKEKKMIAAMDRSNFPLIN